MKEESTRRVLGLRLSALLARALYMQSSEAKLARALRLIEADRSFAGEHPLVAAKIWATTGHTEKAESALESLSASSSVPESEFSLVSAMVAKAKGDAEAAASLVEKVQCSVM